MIRSLMGCVLNPQSSYDFTVHSSVYSLFGWGFRYFDITAIQVAVC